MIDPFRWPRLYDLQRSWRSLTRRWRIGRRVKDCDDCGRALTRDERWWYADERQGRCEACEVAWGDRIAAWRKGAHEPELDSYFSGKPPRMN
jgi:hypothetical protein